MNIPKINFNSNILFGAIRKVPTSSGYKVYDDGLLTEDVSFDIQKRALKKDVFDKSGDKSSTVQISYAHNVSSTTKYLKNKNGMLAQQITTDDKGNVTQETSYKYHTNGNLRLTVIEDHIFNTKYTTIFDEEGKKIITISKNKSGEEVTTYTYNQNGTLRKETTIGQNDKKTGKTVYKYSPKGVLTRCSSYDEKSNLTYEELYDPKTGELLKVSYKDEDGVVVSDEYFYGSEDGRKKFHILKEDDEEISLTRYEYDSQDRLLREVTYVNEKITDIVKYNPRTGKIVSKTEYGDNDKIIVEERFAQDEYGRDVAHSIRTSVNPFPRTQIFDYENNQLVEINTNKRA